MKVYNSEWNGLRCLLWICLRLKVGILRSFWNTWKTSTKKQQQRPNAVPEFSLPENEKVDVDDMMSMLEKSRKRMKEIDDGKLGDIPADY